MDENKKERSAAGKNRTVNLFALRLAVAAYLVYLGFDLLRGFLAGASTLPAASAWGFGLGFMAAGLGFAVYSFLSWRRGAAAEKEKKEQSGGTPGEE